MIKTKIIIPLIALVILISAVVFVQELLATGGIVAQDFNQNLILNDNVVVKGNLFLTSEEDSEKFRDLVIAGSIVANNFEFLGDLKGLIICESYADLKETDGLGNNCANGSADPYSNRAIFLNRIKFSFYNPDNALRFTGNYSNDYPTVKAVGGDVVEELQFSSNKVDIIGEAGKPKKVTVSDNLLNSGKSFHSLGMKSGSLKTEVLRVNEIRRSGTTDAGIRTSQIGPVRVDGNLTISPEAICIPQMDIREGDFVMTGAEEKAKAAGMELDDWLEDNYYVDAFASANVGSDATFQSDIRTDAEGSIGKIFCKIDCLTDCACDLESPEITSAINQAEAGTLTKEQASAILDLGLVKEDDMCRRYFKAYYDGYEAGQCYCFNSQL